jgi:hypothetical protein
MVSSSESISNNIILVSLLNKLNTHLGPQALRLYLKLTDQAAHVNAYVDFWHPLIASVLNYPLVLLLRVGDTYSEPGRGGINLVCLFQGFHVRR